MMRKKLTAFVISLTNFLMPEEVRTEIIRQINSLERTAPDSMEAGVLRNYLDWVLCIAVGNLYRR